MPFKGLLPVFLLTLLTGCEHDQGTLKVGVLHAQTGTMALHEVGVTAATLFAIEELNEAGGVLGKELVPVVMDTESKDELAVEGALTLILDEGVEALFGCWTSSCRREVKPVLELFNHLLFYPVQYEGLEDSRNIVYLGSLPNQQMIPALHWSMDQFGKRIALVGSDYVYPLMANDILKQHITVANGEVLLEQYFPLGHQDFKAIVNDLKNSNVDVVFNTLNGDSSKWFFNELAKQNLPTPIMSFSVSDESLSQVAFTEQNQIYAAGSYFQSIDTKENKNFVERFRKAKGENIKISAAMISAYGAVKLWAKAVSKIKSTDSSTVSQALKGEVFHGPSGEMRISFINQHTWNPLYIAKQENNQFQIVKSFELYIRPITWPTYSKKVHWSSKLDHLYKKWGERWAPRSDSGEYQ